MVISRLAWLRLVVTALLCAAGLARPVAGRWDDAGSRSGRDPIHICAASARAELARVNDRPDDPTGDTVGVVEAPPDRGGMPRCSGELRSVCEQRLARAPYRRGRARGPPLA